MPSVDLASLSTLKESEETTHFSVWDRDGNVVSNTYTLNFSYGNGIAVGGAGFLLNNEMDDFSAKPGAQNGYGLIGGDANPIEPFKRPLSSMTPTIVFDKKGKPLIATGSPGGSTIITIVLQMIVNMIDYDMGVAEATAAPRIHHQWLPDVIYYESGISADTLEILKGMGHVVDDESSVWEPCKVCLEEGACLVSVILGVMVLLLFPSPNISQIVPIFILYDLFLWD